MRFPTLLAAILLPALCSAQSGNFTELFFNAGSQVGKSGVQSAMIRRHPVPVATSAGILFNRGALQYGARFEAVLNGDNMYQLAPALTANYRIIRQLNYWYAGLTAGYQFSRDRSRIFEEMTPRSNHGIMLGAQAGYVHTLSKRFALNAEIGYRFINCRWDYGEIHVPEGMTLCMGYIENPEASFYSTMPITIGIRYRL